MSEINLNISEWNESNHLFHQYSYCWYNQKKNISDWEEIKHINTFDELFIFPFQYELMTIIIPVICVICFLGNCFNYFTYTNMQLDNNPKTLFQILSCIDILVVPFVFPVFLYHVYPEKQNCILLFYNTNFVAPLVFGCIQSSLQILFIITLVRFISISYPDFYKNSLTKEKVITPTIFIIIFVFLINIHFYELLEPQLVIYRNKVIEIININIPYTKSIKLIIFGGFELIILCGLPLDSAFILNIKIIIEYRKMMASRQELGMTQRTIRRESTLFILLNTMIVLYIVAGIPIVIFWTLAPFCDWKSPKYLYLGVFSAIFYLLLFSGSFLVNMLTNAEFSKTFIKHFFCKSNKVDP